MRCLECESFCSMKSELQVSVKITVSQIMIWDETGNTKVFNITGVPTTILKFNNQNYKIQSSIFYGGLGVQSGHYKSLIRTENSWINANDTHIFTINKWPRNSKYAYLLFYKKV